MTMQNAALRVVSELRDAGYEAYLVGGCVRDLLLGREPKDFDVTTNARPEQVQALFLKTIPVGAAFGVVVVVVEEHQIEVATFRTDGQYSDARRPDVVFYSDTAKEDVIRRDFTINGLLLHSIGLPFCHDTVDASVVDYVGGLEDIKAKVIRAIGDPKARFTEDALRMLRAVRFAAQLGFEVEENTKKAIMELAPTITKVSRERVREEMFKLLTAKYAVRGLALLYSTGLFRNLFALNVAEVEAVRQFERFERFQTKDAVEALAMFVTDMKSVAAEEVLKSLKLANDQFDVVYGAVSNKLNVFDGTKNSYDGALMKRFARRKGAALAVKLAEQDEVMGVEEAKDVNLMFGRRFRELTPEEVYPKLLVTGDDLIAMGMKPSPKFKTVLTLVEDIQLRGGFGGGKDREAALRHAKQYLHF